VRCAGVFHLLRESVGVVADLHAGRSVPILSVEAGIDVRACGCLLEPVTIEGIRRQVAAVEGI
jgi:hypothetical protein